MPSILARGSACVALGLLGCSRYSAGSFHGGGRDFTGQYVTVGCLDVAIASDHDPVAPGPVVDYQFGNRCDRAVPVDLGAIRATGRTPSGEEVALVPYDPYREIRGLRLEARTAGRERLEYRKARDFGTDVVQICLALDGLTEAPGGRVCVDTGARVAEVAP